MPEYVLNRNHVLRTTDGVISFEKGVPAWVTPMMEKHAVNIGAQRVDGDAPNPLGEEPPPEVKLTPDERIEQLKVAFALIVEKNDAKEFTGQGVPTVKAVEKITGLEYERGEVLETWAAWKAEQVGEGE